MIERLDQGTILLVVGCSAGITIASALQTTWQAAHAMQSNGRGNQGNCAAISRQVVGQTAMQSPQPVQRVGTRSGSRSCGVMLGCPGRPGQ
jgi:hypothetical protein